MQASRIRRVAALLALCALFALIARTALPEHENKKLEFLELINRYRQENGIALLKMSDALMTAAQLHSEDMAARIYFSHTSLDGRTFVDRIRHAGYTYNTWLGENIAAGYGSAESVFEAWKSSPGHNANMLNSNFLAIGVGVAYNSSSTYGWYWTTDFGGYDDSGGGDNPPHVPEAPSGPVLCAVNLSYGYSTHASDPDGEDVACIFDWGDGTYTTTAMGRSGSLFRAEHVWRTTGVFQVRARAIDSRGRESSWSQPTTVVVKLASTISIGISRASAIRGANLTVSGSLMPRGRYTITLTFTKPDGSRLVERVECDQNGNYSWVVSLDSIGIWNVKASWSGDQNYLGSVSELVKFRVDPPSYPVDFRSNVEGVGIVVDGANCSLPHTFTWTEGSVHSVTAKYLYALSEGARCVFRCWGDGLRSCSRDLVVTGPALYLLNYSIQYLMSVKMLPGTNWSNAWYEKGTSISLSVNSTSIPVDNFSRLVFAGWSDNTVCPEINMTLDGPKTLEAR